MNETSRESELEDARRNMSLAFAAFGVLVAGSVVLFVLSVMMVLGTADSTLAYGRRLRIHSVSESEVADALISAVRAAGIRHRAVTDGEKIRFLHTYDDDGNRHSSAILVMLGREGRDTLLVLSVTHRINGERVAPTESEKNLVDELVSAVVKTLRDRTGSTAM